MDWDEILTDPKTYSDDVKVVINGTELTLGQLRNKTGLKSEFTKHTQTLAEQQKQLQTALAQQQQVLQQREAMLQASQQNLAQALARRGEDPEKVSEDDLAMFRADPTFAPLIGTIDRQKATLTQLAQSTQALATRLQQNEVGINAWFQRQQMDKLKEQDPNLNPQALAEFAHRHYTQGVDVNAMHRLMTYEDTLKAREAEAEKRGYEKAKTEPSAPPMPRGGLRTMGQPALELPKTLDERMSLAAQDPAVIEGLEIGLRELQGG